MHHSSNEVLLAPSKAIVLSTSLVSAINSVIHAACLKGPALADHDEETSSGEVLIYVLLLNYFSLRRSVPTTKFNHRIAFFFRKLTFLFSWFPPVCTLFYLALWTGNISLILQIGCSRFPLSESIATTSADYCILDLVRSNFLLHTACWSCLTDCPISRTEQGRRLYAPRSTKCL